MYAGACACVCVCVRARLEQSLRTRFYALSVITLIIIIYYLRSLEQATLY